MSRTFRLRHLSQPEGGRFARRFVNGRLRFPADRAEEDYLAHLAHTVLALPCALKGGPDSRTSGWRNTHERCLPRDVRDWLWTIRPGGFWRLGWTRTVSLQSHPAVGYGLAVVPSHVKKTDRKLVYRRHRRASKRLLRVLDEVDYGPGPDACCGGLCDPPWAFWVSGPEFDPDSADFDAKGIKAGLARSAWALTW
jgi:hypothetical protein